MNEGSRIEKIDENQASVDPLSKQLHIFFYRQLNFPSEPGVANEILENEAKSCLAVA